MEFFYTPLAEWSKALLYPGLGILIGIGVWKRRFRDDPNWANWIHLAVFIHFILGALYSGSRMLTTDEMEQMLTRRFFAWEAYFNFACAAFYFLFLEFFNHFRSSRPG